MTEETAESELQRRHREDFIEICEEMHKDAILVRYDPNKKVFIEIGEDETEKHSQ